MKIKVLTYNIHKCVGGVDRRYDLGRIVEIINHHQPDIALLQEVVRHSKSLTDTLQVDVIGEAIGLPHRVWVPNVRVSEAKGYGNAIFSRWPLIESVNIDLTIGPKKKRSALYARVRAPIFGQRAGQSQTRGLHLFNLHLGLSGIERRMQLKKLLLHSSLQRVAKNTPIIVAGDLNDVWGSLGRQVMGPAGFHGVRRKPKTFPAYAPVRPLDSLYVRGKIRVENLLPSRLAIARQASDHLPLVAELILGQE